MVLYRCYHISMSLRHAILGLLAIRPMSGYELKKVIDNSVAHFWTADQSQIYRTLTGLVDGGLVTRRTVIQDDRPNMHVHDVTGEGLAELDAWLAPPLETEPKREPYLARIFFADRLGLDGVRALLLARRSEANEVLAALEAIPTPDDPRDLGEVLRMATLSNGIRHVRAELDWLDQVEAQLPGLST